uniref:Ankyrin repeat protein n=2 Tax=Ditylum brightwellii TaxID=49249 RepID=A0A7S4W510_9STRA
MQTILTMTEPNIFQLIELLYKTKDGQKQKIYDDISTLLQKQPDAAKQKDENGLIPLHSAIFKRSPFEVVDALLEVWPDAAKEKNSVGWTPLHACLFRPAPDVVAALLKAWPEAVKEKDNIGYTPLQMSFSLKASFEVTPLLLNAWLGYKENRTKWAIMYFRVYTRFCTEDVEVLLSRLFDLYNSNTHTLPPKEIMDYFIHIEMWNAVTLVLDRNPAVIKTMGLDTKVMADLLSTVGRCCSLNTMWEVLCNEQDLLEGV